jgi:DNA-binding MarR family transcriptional regulator
MTERTPDGDAFTAVVLHVLRINGLLHLAGDAITKPVKQSSARWRVMGTIDSKPRTVAEIARLLGTARQSIQRIADVLVSEGTVAYRDNPAHQRAKLLSLTSPGRKSLQVIQAGQHLWANRVGGQLGEKTLKQMSTLLQRLSDVLENDPVLCEKER